MKKLILVLGILVAANILVAQDRERAPRKAEIKIEEYKERLNLTNDQETQWEEVRAKYRPEFKAIKQDESKSRSEKMRAAADVEEQKEADLAEILSEDQLQELAVIKSEIRQKRRKRHIRRQRGN